MQHQNLQLPRRISRRGVCRYTIGTIRLCGHATTPDAYYSNADIGWARRTKAGKAVADEEQLVHSVKDGW